MNNLDETEKMVREGLMRLAFGRINDAVRLAYEKELSPRTLKRLDLFSVAGVKLSKDGAVEIRFADRLAALEKLSELAREQDGDDEAQRMIELIYRDKDTDGAKGADSDG